MHLNWLVAIVPRSRTSPRPSWSSATSISATWPGELEEVGSRHEASAGREQPTFGTEVDDRRSLGSAGCKTPPQLRKIYAVGMAADDRSDFGRPNVVSRFQIRRGNRKAKRQSDLTERLDILVVGDAIAIDGVIAVHTLRRAP